MTWVLIDLALKSGQPFSEVLSMDEWTRSMLIRYLMKRGTQ